MNTLKMTLRVGTLSALAGTMLLFGVAAHAEAPPAPGLYSTVPITAKTVLPRHALRGKSKGVKINHKNLRAGRLSVSLPGDKTFEAVREMHQDLGNGRSSWIGHANGNPGNTVVLGVSGNAVAGTFSVDGKLFKLEPRADGSQVVSEVDSTDPAPELDPIPVADTVTNNAAPPAPADAAAGGAGPVIDVLVAYTPAVKALYGAAGAEALIVQAVSEANLAYTNSKMATRLNLVRSVMTIYVESGDMATDLSRLRSTSDGYMDELHALRDSTGADLVSLIADAPQNCGMGYLMTTLSVSFASSAFNVVHHSCATGYYSFAHEIGHNQGAHHDAANASGAIYPYAYGYQDPYGRFRSVMAYDCPNGCPRAAMFSNSEVFVYGVIPTGDPNFAANARTIDQTAPTVAAFRQPPATVSPPAAPINLNSPDSGLNDITLAWTDTSSNESGFLLERSIDGLNFTQVASLPANTASYVDNGLQSATNYNYRIRGWNSAAKSAYSNVATATTDTPAPVIITPPPFVLSAVGSKVNSRQRVNLTWTGAPSSTVDIYRDGTRIKKATANTGSYLDAINRTGGGTYRYKICVAGKTTCSNIVTVTF